MNGSNELVADQNKYDDIIQQMINKRSEWEDQSIHSRIKKIKILRKIISKRADEIANAIAEECSRSKFESLTQEVLPVLEMSKYCESHYKKWLKTKSFKYFRPGFLRKTNYLVKEPIGIISVITPFNFPFSLGMMSLVYILLAGNSVVLKPSPKSKKVASLIIDLLSEAGLSPGIANVITGDGETGDYLVEHSNIDKIFFFGSKLIGNTIFEKCRHLGKQCVLELGGGTTALVSSDANIKLSAAGIAWSSFYSNGMSCIGTERVFIEKPVEDDFLNLLKSDAVKYQETTCNSKTTTGPLTKYDVDRLQKIIEFAVDKDNAEILCGGKFINMGQDSFCLENTVIKVKSNESKILEEEIFGPIVVVCPVENMEQIIEKLNSSLGVSIWKRNQKDALKIAKKINTGMIWINDTSYGLPNLPWFGLMDNGWGRIFSEESLHEVLNIKWISAHPSFSAQKRFWWYPYTPIKQKIVKFIAKKFY
ncbi:MAG: aldehyde dehydrogenase family protein [Bacteroidota bacterium]